MNVRFFKIQIYFLCFIVLYCNAYAQQNNNNIFFGGSGSGASTLSYSQADAVLNNNIFSGGIASGYDMSYYIQANAILNNSIFAGGIAAGYHMFNYTQADAVLNNSIFAGGIAAGYDMSYYIQADAILNNSIFAGGIAAGYDMSYYIQADAILNNNIFLGGIAAGFIASSTGEIEVPLPITLLYFEALVRERKVYLEWATASEINNDFFTVERSKNGSAWEKVVEVKGAESSSTLLTYNTIDQTPYRGISYYRLKQTDFNGKQTYSNIKTVNIDTENTIKLFPNPANDRFYIITSSEADYNVTISDIYGKTVFNDNNSKEVSTQNFSHGMYIVRISFMGGETTIEKLIVNK
ncbi:MAG TPA: T9SS type A sorting domain-containing protein [Salinivirgaceae bacterium]|nr:T9SS type A sorting domain-containing protein [Salinivirgaceae bacterium]